MKLSKNLVLSVEILAAHKLRTLLSISGMFVGIAAVILVVSAGRGAEKRILDHIRDMGTDLIMVNAGQARVVAGRRRQMSTVTTLVPEDAEAIARECPSVARACPAVGKKLPVRFESETTNTNVVGMEPDGFVIRNMAIASGRLFTSQESRARRRTAVLGPTVARNLFGETDPVGFRVRIGRVPFEVAGVLAAKGVDPNGADQDDIVVIPLGAAMRRLMNVTHVGSVYVQARGTALLKRAEREVVELLRQRHRLGGKPDDFTIRNQVTLIETHRATARNMTLLTGSVAAISLLVGGVGILAVMLISVGERTREIGLRRALGARRRDIRTQFLLESTVIAGAGGAVGIALGVAASFAASSLGQWDSVVSWSVTAVAFAFSVTLGVIFGAYPAIRAARLEPTEALRAE